MALASTMPLSLTLLLNFHRERALALRTLRYAKLVRETCMKDLQVVAVMDRPDDFTRETVERFCAQAEFEIFEVNFVNLGQSRQFGIAAVRTELISFLDGDDLASLNWLPAAREYLASFSFSQHIAHSQYFAGFGKQEYVRIGIDSRSQEFDSRMLLFDWFFCNNLMCRTEVFEAVPLTPYDHSRGIGAEDWHWSANTLIEGFDHVIIPETAYFYRVKPSEQSLGSGNFLPWPSEAWTSERSLSSHRLRAPGVRDTGEREITAIEPNNADVRKSLVCLAKGVVEIEPAVSWVCDNETDLNIVVPTIDQEFVDLAERIYGQDIASLAVVSHELFNDDVPEVVKHIRRLLGKNAIIISTSPISAQFEDIPGFFGPPSSLETWRQKFWFSRLVARIVIDFQPQRVILQPEHDVLALLESYTVQIRSFTSEVFILDMSVFEDVFESAMTKKFISAFPEAITLSYHPLIGAPVLPTLLSPVNRLRCQAEKDAGLSEAQKKIGIADKEELTDASLGADRKVVPLHADIGGQSGYRIVTNSGTVLSPGFFGPEVQELLTKANPARSVFLPCRQAHSTDRAVDILLFEATDNLFSAILRSNAFIIGNEAYDAELANDAGTQGWSVVLGKLLQAHLSMRLDVKFIPIPALSVTLKDLPAYDIGKALRYAENAST